MKTIAIVSALAAGLCFSISSFAQAPASAPVGTTGLCKDGSFYSGASKKGACSGHKGLKTWYGASKAAAASGAAAATAPAAAASAPAAASGASSPAAATKGTARRRARPGLGEHRYQGVPLRNRQVLRQDQARRIHVGSSREGEGLPRVARQDVFVTSLRADAPGPAASVPLRTAMRRASATRATARLARSRRASHPAAATAARCAADRCKRIERCTNLNDFGE